MNRWLCSAILGAAAIGASEAQPVIDFRQFAYHQRTGSAIPAGAVFRDAEDRPVRLADVGHGAPVILVPAYFRCPNLCGVVRASLFGALRPLALTAGRDYVLAVLSVDPGETESDARAAKARDVASFGVPGADRDWRYLTGRAEDIQAVADAIGLRDRVDPDTKQILHPAGVVFLTPGGIVSNYLLGVGYRPAQVRSALERAGAGEVAAAGAPLLLLCFHFDPTTGRYTLEVLKVIRLAAALTLATIVGSLWLLFRRERAA